MFRVLESFEAVLEGFGVQEDPRSHGFGFAGF